LLLYFALSPILLTNFLQALVQGLTDRPLGILIETPHNTRREWIAACLLRHLRQNIFLQQFVALLAVACHEKLVLRIPLSESCCPRIPIRKALALYECRKKRLFGIDAS
jgi:hypothetical protein